MWSMSLLPSSLESVVTKYQRERIQHCYMHPRFCLIWFLLHLPQMPNVCHYFMGTLGRRWLTMSQSVQTMSTAVAPYFQTTVSVPSNQPKKQNPPSGQKSGVILPNSRRCWGKHIPFSTGVKGQTGDSNSAIQTTVFLFQSPILSPPVTGSWKKQPGDTGYQIRENLHLEV